MRKHLLFFLLIFIAGCTEEPTSYTVIVSSNPSEGGSVTPDGGIYNEGQSASFTATPNEFYEFSGWSGADTSSINPVSILIDSDKSLTARFEKLDTDNDGVTDDIDQCPDTPANEQADSNGCSVSQKDFELSISVEGEGTVTEEVVVAPTIYQGTTQVQLTAVPAEGWEFTEWTGNATGTDNPITIEIDGTKNITAVFTKKDTDGDGVPDLEDTCADTPEGEEADENGCSLSQKEFVLTVTTEGEGTVTEELIVSPTIYQGTSQVKLTAVPAEGWELIEWTGDATGSENPITIEIDGAKSITAVFAKKDTDGDGVPDLDDLCEDTPEGSTVNANGCHDIIYIDENGVTVKARETAVIGDTQELNGKVYKVVDEAILREMIANDDDVTIAVTTRVSNFKGLFYQKTLFNQDIGSWDTSSVTDMDGVFYSATSFKQDLNKWDVSKVVNFEGAFEGATSFNGDITAWDTSAATSTKDMFYGASSFNQPIGNWDVRNVRFFTRMFREALSFNQDLSGWNLASAEELDFMFMNAQVFNQNINSWNVSSVTNMEAMFFAAKSFNQPLNDWDTSSTVKMGGMFRETRDFNEDISAWDVENVVEFQRMFYSANAFNQNLSNWCVSGVTTPPDGFDTNASNWVLPRPNWGNCGTQNAVYLDENGITIRAYEWAEVGDTGEINNKVYKVVDEAMLREMIANGDDVTTVVTTKITSFKFLFSEDSYFNQDISSWDTSSVVDMERMFYNATSFNQNLNAWDVSKVTNFKSLFLEASEFNGDITDWNTSSAVSMEAMFYGAASFNQSIGGWDVRNVQSFRTMFRRALTFNQDLSEWKLNNAERLDFMFMNAKAFNQNINSWNISNVSNLEGIFWGADNYNQPLNNWNTGNVENMGSMFREAISFNQNISNWDVSKVSEFTRMFYTASVFNQDLSNWCVSGVTTTPDGFDTNASSWVLPRPNWGNCGVSGAIYLDENGITVKATELAEIGEFYELETNGELYKVVDENMLRAMVNNGEDVTHVVTTFVESLNSLFLSSNFNQDISSWDVGNVTDMFLLFSSSTFDRTLSSWDVSNVTNMGGMFSSSSFNGDISNWDVSNVTDMGTMFAYSSFNTSISNWNVSSVTNMDGMFSSSSFNGDISNWDVSNVTDMNEMFSGTEFNQDLSSWEVSNVSRCSSFSRNTPNWTLAKPNFTNCNPN